MKIYEGELRRRREVLALLEKKILEIDRKQLLSKIEGKWCNYFQKVVSIKKAFKQDFLNFSPRKIVLESYSVSLTRKIDLKASEGQKSRKGKSFLRPMQLSLVACLFGSKLHPLSLFVCLAIPFELSHRRESLSAFIQVFCRRPKVSTLWILQPNHKACVGISSLWFSPDPAIFLFATISQFHFNHGAYW